MFQICWHVHIFCDKVVATDMLSFIATVEKSQRHKGKQILFAVLVFNDLPLNMTGWGIPGTVFAVKCYSLTH